MTNRSEENGHRMAEIHPTANSDALRDDVSYDPKDSWLPSIGSRNGKWWYSTIHNVTAIVGAGVLGLPASMVYLGWGAGAVVLVMSWVITLFTLWQMVEMHENLPGMLPGERITTYHELGQRAFGEKRGLWIVLTQQLIVQVGTDIVYLITGGQCLWLFYQLLLCDEHLDVVALGDGTQCCGKLGRTVFILFFASVQIVLSQLGGFDSIATLSFLASVTAVGYSTIAWVDSVILGSDIHKAFVPSEQPMAICQTSYSFPHHSLRDQVFGVFRALGVVGFAYSGHNVVLEIQSTLPSIPGKLSKIPMWRGVKLAYVIIAFCYIPVAFAGYWAFGNYLVNIGSGHGGSGNILLQLGKPRGLIATATIMVVFHLMGSYQVYAIPVFDLVERVLVMKFGFEPILPGSMVRIVTRTIYVLFTASIACTFPFFNDLLAFFGGIAFMPTTYFVPCIIWLRLKRPKKFSISWLLNWLLILIGGLLTIVASIGGLAFLVIDSHFTYDYKNCSSTIDFPRYCKNVSVHSGGYTFYQFTCEASQNHNSTKCNIIFDKFH